MSSQYVMVSIADEVQYDSLQLAMYHLVRQYALCIRRGNSNIATYRKMLCEIEMTREHLDRIEKQITKLLEGLK